MYEIALSILKEIEQLGYEAYIVGGYPRNKFLSLESKDIDISTSMPPEKIEQTFLILENHKQYGSFIIEKNDYPFEITTFRKDTYEKKRYPTIQFVKTLKEDLQRRDFVINTLCIDSNGHYIDLIGAKEDIKNKIIRTVGNCNMKLQEDPLRIIRALRFASDLDFQLDLSILYYIKQNKKQLHTLSKKRVQKEIAKIHSFEKWNYWIKLLDLKDYLP